MHTGIMVLSVYSIKTWLASSTRAHMMLGCQSEAKPPSLPKFMSKKVCTREGLTTNPTRKLAGRETQLMRI